MVSDTWYKHRGLIMTDLDISKLIKNLDEEGMTGYTRNFINDIEKAINIPMDIEVDTNWSGVLCLGMGGSGAGGDFLASLTNYEGGLPFVVWKDYGLPSWWGPDWLIIATSYSGNTEETLEGVSQALESGGTVIGITSGGQLEEILANHDDSLCLYVPEGQMPRSAFGHIFGTQLSICWSLGLLPKPDELELKNMLGRLRSSSKNTDLIGGNGLAIKMAKSMVGKQIGIISPTLLGSAGSRFANQLNENSDRFARNVNLPEMNHNEIVAWSKAKNNLNSVIYLSWGGMSQRVNSRLNWTMDELDIKSSWFIDCEGETLLESLLYAAHITDWISVALALIEGTNPSAMPSIIALKEYLSTI
ncbi:MAG: SIS domain-containing protein [Candidatus Poseidoniales archaeon]|jgi:glucose/mannose-6-phosphate isomerase